MSGASASANEPRIWLNVTTSTNWTRPAVGIVRVEMELCKELSKLYGDRFSQCVVKNGAFVPHVPDIGENETETALFWPEASRRFPKSSTFEFISGDKKITAVSVEPTADLETRKVTTFDSKPKISFGDIIISVGLDWDHGTADLFADLNRKMGIRFVTCCYDLIPILFPQFCVGEVSAYFKQYFTKLSWSSSLILCISKQSEQDYRKLAENMGFPYVPTAVIPLGDNVAPAVVDDEAEREIAINVVRAMDEPFILFVGTIERRKNHEVLYRAYHLLAREGKLADVPKLVFVGMAGWGVGDLLKDIELDPLVKNKIMLLNHVSDTELALLYENAKFFVYPSFYEGWGLPVGEALAFGKVVIASDQGSIPEVGGNLVIYADAWNPREWAEQIYRLATSRDILEAYASNIAKNYHKREWSETAVVVRNAITSLIEQAPPKPITFYPGYDMHTSIGLPCGGTVLSTGEAGALTYGPYVGLEKGAYDIEIFFDKLFGSAGNCQAVVASDIGQTVHASLGHRFEMNETMSGSILMRRVLFETAVTDYEVAVYIDKGLMISISRIEVRPALQQSTSKLS
ncbi:MAG: glycosyltransferase family 1 protein [bacterium]|nr:glycosyltransferase family 1 protein [bacterium]